MRAQFLVRAKQLNHVIKFKLHILQNTQTIRKTSRRHKNKSSRQSLFSKESFFGEPNASLTEYLEKNTGEKTRPAAV